MSDTHDDEIVHRQMTTETDADPAVQIVEYISHLKGTDQEELDNLWQTIDHIVEHIFSEPPSPDAQVQVTFTYEGYRITVEQDGTTKLVRID